MNTSVVLVLVRKHLVEAKWMLGICATAFFALAVLSTWLTLRFERLIDASTSTSGPDFRRIGILRGLGGEAMDFSTTAIEVCWWNHPVIVLTVLAWAITRGSNSVAGEIERGTIDVTFSRPVSRAGYLLSQIGFTVLGLLILAGALILGLKVGALFFTLKSPPSFLTLLRPAAIVVTMGMAVYGYTLPLSTIDVVRWRPSLVSCVVTLGGLVALSLARTFPDYQRLLQSVSVFQLYAPVTVALKTDPLAYNASVLSAVFLAGCAVSFALFSRRDLPSNS